MKNKMALKLAACFAVVLLLFTAVLGAVFLTLFRRHTIALNHTSMVEKAVSIADTLSSFETGGIGMGRNGKGGYGAYLRFLNELAMAEVWIVDENLNLLTRRHGGQEITYAQLPQNAEQIVAEVFTGEVTYGEEFSGLLGAPSLTVGAPIYIEDTVAGAVLLHSPVSGVDEAVQQGLFALSIGTGVALLFAGFAFALLAYRFTRPLSKMNAAALCLSKGNYLAKTGVTQQDEIGQLARTIDELTIQLQLADAERTALDQLREGFVTNISHELRTPVAVLRGSLEILQDGTVNDPKEVADYYEQMLSESNHLERLVNDLLELSRLQDIGFKLELSEVNLCDVVRDVTRAIRRTAQQKQIAIVSALPEQACPIFGDYGRIRQLLFILLDNAVKFSYAESSVEISLVQDNGFILSVTDHGEGVPKEELPYIFDRFHKTASPQNKTGTGLGLAIAKEIASRHHGKLYCQSENGTTLFTVHFSMSEANPIDWH